MDSTNKIKAFSLVELIVGITISMLLMVSIGVFVSSGIKNIFLQQKSLEFASNINDFSNTLYETFSNIQNSGSINTTSSGIIFKRNMDFSKGGFTYIGTTELDNYFCEDNSLEESERKTNHVFIKDFIPFFEELDDKNSNSYLTGSVDHSGSIYISHQKEHKITDTSGNTIVGKGVFGDLFQEGSSGTGIYLNSPTGMASDGEVIYISDTLNNRVLYLSGSTVHKLLDENDGILEPTGLYYDSNTLYIANSGKDEILKITSENVIEPISKNISFSGITQNSNNIIIEFFRNKNPHNISTIDINTPVFNNITDDLTYINFNKYSHSFMSGSTIEYILFNGATTYEIELNNLSDFSLSGVYSINLNIGTSEKNYYFFTKGDDKIYTMIDNKVEVIRSGLNYPNGIWGNPGTNIFPNNSNIYEFNTSTLISNLDSDLENDIILKNPIYNLDISRDGGGSGNLLNIILKHYKNYNCYNLDENKEKIGTFLIKTMLE